MYPVCKTKSFLCIQQVVYDLEKMFQRITHKIEIQFGLKLSRKKQNVYTDDHKNLLTVSTPVAHTQKSLHSSKKRRTKPRDFGCQGQTRSLAEMSETPT